MRTAKRLLALLAAFAALPLHAAPDKLTAKYADGILEVTVPIVEMPAPKEMKVEIA